jgi:hypothetical protein
MTVLDDDRLRPIADATERWQVLRMLAGLAIILAPSIVSGGVETPREGIRSVVCRQKLPALAGDEFSLLALPAKDKNNESGVVLLVNCSRRVIVSVRDPKNSPRRLTEFVYDRRVKKRISQDGNHYEFLNFNERAKNSFMEANSYSKDTYWRGPCRFDGLELTTVEPDTEENPRKITFSLNVCENIVLALVEAP